MFVAERPDTSALRRRMASKTEIAHTFTRGVLLTFARTSQGTAGEETKHRDRMSC